MENSNLQSEKGRCGMRDIIKKVLQFLFGEASADCTDCIYGTSTGTGICRECDGRYFERKQDSEE